MERRELRLGGGSDNGELENVNPKVVVLQAGTNNITRDASAADIAKGVQAILGVIQAKAPNAKVIVTGIFARNDNNSAAMPVVREVNQILAKTATADVKVRFLDINDKLADPATGRLQEGMMNPDKLHPALKGYQVWAEALKPLLREILGPPAAEDHAPPPTGDPSAPNRASR
jgi:lysophospholipase L1-like esterase